MIIASIGATNPQIAPLSVAIQQLAFIRSIDYVHMLFTYNLQVLVPILIMSSSKSDPYNQEWSTYWQNVMW